MGDGAIHGERDTIGLHEGDDWVWRCERAKIAQWRHRSQCTDEQLAEWGIQQEASSLVSQSRGFRMPAWNLLEHLRQEEGYTVTVGPSVFEAPPTFEWSTVAEEFCWKPNDIPLVLLGAIPETYHVEVLRRLAEHGTGAVIARESDMQATDFQSLSTSMGSGYLVHDTHEATYSVEWWHSGNKRLTAAKDQVLHYFRFHDTVDFQVDPPRQHPPVPLRAENIAADLQAYLDATPSGPYQKNPGAHIWTDGSKQKMPNYEVAGAGIYGFFPTLRRHHFQVGGEANSFRAELCALAVAIRMANPLLPAYFYTDSMSALQIIARWRKGDFAPSIEEEEHDDVLLDILDAIRDRIAATHFVWVKSHCGDPGNEVADYEADLGCHSKNKRSHRKGEPIAVHDFRTSALITKRGWTRGVERHARKYEGELQREHLHLTSDAMSTSSVSLFMDDLSV